MPVPRSDRITDPAELASVVGCFYVSEVRLSPGNGGSQGSVKLNVVSRGARNSSWSAATPSGEITMHVSNPTAFEEFVKAVQSPDRPEYLVYFVPRPVPRALDGHAFAPSPEGHYNAPRCADCGEESSAHMVDG